MGGVATEIATPPRFSPLNSAVKYPSQNHARPFYDKIFRNRFSLRSFRQTKAFQDDRKDEFRR